MTVIAPWPSRGSCFGVAIALVGTLALAAAIGALVVLATDGIGLAVAVLYRGAREPEVCDLTFAAPRRCPASLHLER